MMLSLQNAYTAETFSGVKALKLTGREHANLTCFNNAMHRLAHLQAKAQTLGEVPRFGIEAAAFDRVIVLTLALMWQHG